jgi:peptide/nickel transport system substrate-binding protein
VKASYERQQKPPKSLATAPRGDQLKPIVSMQTPDKYTLVLKMGRPVSALSMLPILAQGWMAIYSEKDIVADFDFKKKVNGTGPYIQKSYERGNKVVFDKNKDYFVKDRPYLDGMTVYIVPDASTSLANFQSGQIDYRGLNVTEFGSMQKALGDKIEIQTVSSYGYEVINFNSQKKPWSDARVRRAVAMAVNRDDYIKVIGQGEGRPGGYHVDGGYWAISSDELLKIPGYEKANANTIAEARKLLDAAGVPNNSGPEVDLLTRAGSSFEPLSIFIVDQLQKVGIKSKVNIQETATAYDRLRTRDFDLCPWSHGFALDDPDALWAEFYVTGAPRNYSELSTKAIDELFLKQSSEQDQKKRLELVKELQRISIPEYGKVIMAHSQGRHAQWKKVMDHVAHASTYNNRRWESVWLNA